MAQKKKADVKHCDVLLVHGSQFGLVDLDNLKKHLDAAGCRECWLYVETAPVDRVQRGLEEDERIQLRVTDTPKKAAKAFFEELQQSDRSADMQRLEKVSDRSMNKGAC
jgi:hypothetical protein